LFLSVATNFNPQFTDVTIDAGSTLDVPSGAVIRCTGTCTINGTINVLGVGSVASKGYFNSGSPLIFDPAGAGVSGDPAGGGSIGDATSSHLGGVGATGLSEFFARSI